MVNVFREPQFSQVASQNLLTIQVSDSETFRLLGLSLEDSFLLDLKDEFFPLIGYGYPWQLDTKLAGLRRLSDVEMLESDFSPKAKGYRWVGLYLLNPDLDSEVGEEQDSQLHVGYCNPGEVDDVRFGTDISYETFHVYPLFREPTNEELETVMCS